MAQSEKRNHYTTVKMAPCKVCGGTSTGYHFGAITCEACKAFFRRSLNRKSYSNYSCQRNDKCGEVPKNITGCVACRLKRCLDAGMSKEGVRRGRYSIALRTKSILEAKQALGPTGLENNCDGTETKQYVHEKDQNGEITSEINGRLVLTEQPAGTVSVHNTAVRHGVTPRLEPSSEGRWPAASPKPVESPVSPLEGPHGNLAHEVSVTEKKYIEFIIDRLVTLQSMLYPHTEVTEDIVLRQKQIEEEHIYREEAFKCLFGSSNAFATTVEFQEVLQQANLELDDRLVTFRDKARSTEEHIVMYIRHSNFIPGFERLHKDDIQKLLKAAYCEFWLFSNYAGMNEATGVSGGTDGVMHAHKKVTSAFFDQDYIDMVFLYAKTLQKMDLSKEEIAIIRVILLTFTDRCTLKYPAKVENLQMLFIRCLRYHLSKTRADPNLRFYKIFDKLISIRSLTHKNSSVNKQFLNDWGFLMDEFPIWKTMMEYTVNLLSDTQ